VIDHQEIFSDASLLPTYNSRAIETQLHHIKELSEYFVYFNDDMFIGNFCTPEQFFRNGNKAYIFVSEIIPIPNRKSFDISHRQIEARNDHQCAIVNTRKIIRDKFNKAIYFNFRHGPIPLIRSVLYEIEEVFKEEILRTSRNFFRTEEEVIIQYLFGYYTLIKKRGRTKYLKSVRPGNNPLNKFALFDKKFTFGFLNLHDEEIDRKLNSIKVNKPFLICLNQTPKTPGKNIQKTKEFLLEYYPEKCPFEKE
jgi:hypothetical protein